MASLKSHELSLIIPYGVVSWMLERFREMLGNLLIKLNIVILMEDKALKCCREIFYYRKSDDPDWSKWKSIDGKMFWEWTAAEVGCHYK